MKKVIIAGFAGVGKSMLAKKYSNVIDLEIMDYKWDYTKEIPEIEKRKGSQNKKRKEEWPNNYLAAIKEAFDKYDIVLISTDNEIIDLLDENGIDYIICLPKRECKNEYMERYRLRENTEEFIARVGDTFEDLLQGLEQRRNKKIVLNSKETLESKLLELTIDRKKMDEDNQER